MLLSVSAASVPVSAPAASPAIYNLGTLGGSASYGTGVNDAGQVVGYSQTAGNAAYRAFRYDGTPGSGGIMRDLGTLGTSTNSYGYGINASGQVAGYNDTSGTPNHAFRYDGTPGSDGIMRDLGTLGGTYSFGYGINDAGQIAGNSATTGNSSNHAFRYTGTPGSGGAMADLGTLGETFIVSQARAINISGQVAGFSQSPGGGSNHAIRYDGTPGSGGIMRDLGTLGGDAEGHDVNASGQVAGGSGTAGNAAWHAFRYDGTPGSGGTMRDLGTLNGSNSFAYALNDSGQVVGWWGNTAFNPFHAFLYTGTPGVDGQMIDLDAWLDANNPTEGAKWTLTAAQGISNTGWITGYGAYNDGPGGLSDGTRAFLLDASLVPEPSSPSLFALASMGVLRRRARRPRTRAA